KLKEKVSAWDLATRGKNLFVDLMQRIAAELNVSSCWICGGSQMTEQWPWRRESVGPQQLLEWNNTHKSSTARLEGWVLSHEIIGQFCISRNG
ncbi:ENR1 protein, partial [Thinocorus orbignyianus]|nr:ENR1 protein [Thinocorus orbignyianus]